MLLDPFSIPDNCYVLLGYVRYVPCGKNLHNLWGALFVQNDVSIKASAQKSTLKYRSYLVILDLGATPGMLQFAAAVSKYISASLIYLAMPGWSSRILWFMILDIAYRNKSKYQMANVLWCSICTELCGQFVPESAGLCRVLVQSCTTGEFRQEKRAQNRANCANLRVSSNCFLNHMNESDRLWVKVVKSFNQLLFVSFLCTHGFGMRSWPAILGLTI